MGGIIPESVGGLLRNQHSYLFGQSWLKNGDDTVADAHFQEFVNREYSVGMIMMREHIEEMVGRVRETIARQKGR